VGVSLVSRLFADFTVLFIGYSLNDPVLRYMTDAFAAEDAELRLSEPRGPAYIFLPYHGEVPSPAEAYQHRNLEPIFYNATNDHLRLQETILAWADAREDYLANTTGLITRIAPTRPDAINPTETANLLLAVTGREDDHGHGARVFARAGGDKDPPPIEWLDAFEQREREIREQYANACEKAERADRRPPPEPTYHFASLFQTGASDPNLTPVAARLIPWLVRHLATRGMVERVLTKLSQGRQPHPEWRHAIREALREPTDLRPGYLRFWRILAAEGALVGWSYRPLFRASMVC
jgi:SIR2-like domain